MFHQKNVDNLVAETVENNEILSSLMCDYRAFIGGGITESLLKGRSIKQHLQKNTTADIDFYFQTEEDYRSAVDYLFNKASETNDRMEKSVTGLCHNYFFSSSCNYTVLKIQLVGCVFGTPEDVVSTFDFKNLEMFCSYKSGVYILDYAKEIKSYKDLLDIRHSRSPFLMHRIYKYIKYRGYSGITERSRHHLTDWIIKASSGFYKENTDHCPHIYVDLLDNSYVKTFLRHRNIITDEDLVYMIGKIKEDVFKSQDYICSRGYSRSTFVFDRKKDLVIEEIKRRGNNENNQKVS